jgi:hypothetical protein
MLKRRCRLALLIALFPICSIAEGGDWGYAHITFLKAKLNKDWSAFTSSQVTWRDDLSDFYFYYVDAGLSYKINPNWQIGAAYRYAEWDIQDHFEREDRPLINLTWSAKPNGIKIANRARMEFRYYDWDKDDDIRFRNRTRIEFPWEVLPGAIKPYLEEEVFYGRNSGKVEMNWLMAGLYCKPTDHLKIKAGYRWFAIRDAAGNWENRNQLVTGMILLF